MKIVHVNNIANVAWNLAQGQRQLGHEVVVCSLFESPFDFPSDVMIPGAQGPIGFNREMFSRRQFFSEFDVVHVHGGIWRAQLFYPWFKTRFPRKVLAVHFHGSEVRRSKGLHYMHWADRKFHSTPDLGRWLRGSAWIPNAVEMPPAPRNPENPIPRIGHFVSNPVLKGTSEVIELFRRAFGRSRTTTNGPMTRFETDRAELLIVVRVPHLEALRVLEGCDVVIDQISGFGSYGMVSIEAMAFGKPVFCTFNPDWYPGCPIIRITDGVESELVAVSEDARYRHRLQHAGRDYVRRVHECRKVAGQVMKAYEPS